MISDQASFVHLQVHTEYSLVDSVIRIGSLIEKAKNCQMSAVAMTDEMALFGMVKFYKAACAQGIKPIIGSEILTDEGRITLLCRDALGYRHLTQLISRAYQVSWRQGRPFVPWHWLEENPELANGLIALSTVSEGILQPLFNQDEIQMGLCQQWMDRRAALFPDAFYIEMRRMGDQPDPRMDQIFDFAARFDLPLVATGAVRFLEPDDFDAHEARVAVGSGYKLNDPTRPRRYSPDQYFKTTDQMRQLWADAPSLITNAVEISKRCNLELKLDQVFLPRCPIPNDLSMEAYLEQSALKGLERRLGARSLTSEQQKIYHDRLQLEVSVIGEMGFAGYFLIVADFIGWAKSQKIPVGPGRGSGAGSLVAYVLGITDLDPLDYDLLFERFLNPERVSMPDFDIDFCMEGRDRVIQYVAETYGRDSVSQIITFGTMAAKAVIRDVGRVLDQPYGFVDKIAKLIPFALGMTLKQALEDEPLLQKRYEEEEEVKSLIDLALKLEGLTRNVGKHAGGVVIAPSRLTDFVPLYFEEGTQVPVSQFDKDDVEKIGLVKFDFLGLKTLTIIDWALQNIRQKQHDLNSTEASIQIDAIPLNDPATFKLFCSGRTTAVFQLESDGMQDLITRLRPDSFEDIIALVALYRPGPLQSGMVDDFIARKHGLQEIAYPHPDLELVLRPTYGVILYQEQVMQIAQVLSGYTLGQADLLRRAMGKKKPEEMVKQRTIFKEGAVARGIEGSLAESIFDLMEKFAGYGFNKSHSAAYALISYQTAWLKAHYPECFMAAVLSADMQHTDKVVHFLNECDHMGLTVLKPNVQSSAFHFTVNAAHQIQYGLGAIKGVGEGAVQGIVEARQTGQFKSFFDFLRRIDLKRSNKRTLEALILSGALDEFGSRKALICSLEKAMSWAAKMVKHAASGQMDLFALFEEDRLLSEPMLETVLPYSFDERLKAEKSVLGHYLSGHPLDPYQAVLKARGIRILNQLKPTEKAEQVQVAGLIHSMKIKKSAKGDPILFATLEDQSGQLDLAFFGDAFQNYREHIEAGEIYGIEGRIRLNPFNGRVRLSVQSLFSLKEWRSRGLRQMTLFWGAEPERATLLKTALAPHVIPSSELACRVNLIYQSHGENYEIGLGTWGYVRASPELLAALEPLFPHPKQWVLEYDPTIV